MTDDSGALLVDGEPQGRVICQSHIRARGSDPIGFHVTVTETVGGFAVRWLDSDEDLTDTYPTLNEASDNYEEMVRALGPGNDGLNGVGDPIWDETDVEFREHSPSSDEDGRELVLACRQCRSSVAPRAVAGGPALPPFSGMATTAFILSLMWLGGLGSLVGVFLSALAVKETKSGRCAGRSLAVAALILSVMGLIVPMIILVGIMILGNQLTDQFNQVSQQLGG